MVEQVEADDVPTDHEEVVATKESANPQPSHNAETTKRPPLLRVISSFPARAARRVARWPKTHFWVSLLLTLTVSGLGMYYGEFTVHVENIGWPSRGTLVSNRHTQVMLVNINMHTLARPNNDEAWEELTTVVQPGWEEAQTRRRRLQQEEAEEEEDSNRQHVLSYEYKQPSASQITNAWRQKQQNDEHVFYARHLQEDQTTASGNQSSYSGSTLITLIDNCDIEQYAEHRFYTTRKLWPVWRLTSDYRSKNATASALDPAVLEELCTAESHTQQILVDNDLCGGCWNGDCLPPFSVVLYARFIVPGGFEMDCSTLATEWAPYQAEEESKWMGCVAYLRTISGQEIGEYERGPCPAMFSPSFVDDYFDQTGRVEYTSTMFVSDRNAAEQYELSEDFGRGGDKVEGVYDTQYGNFIKYYATEIVNQDLMMALGSAALTTFAMLVHTRSPFLTLIGVVEISLSFPLAFTVYHFVGQLPFFPFLNLIGVFVVFALGADCVFVMVDKWKNLRNEYPRATTEEIASQALPSAGHAMALTTITTAIAFFGSALCPVAPVKLFALFCGLLIVFDYMLDVLIMFPCLCIYDGYRFQRNSFVHIGWCDASTNNDGDDQVEKEKEEKEVIKADTEGETGDDEEIEDRVQMEHTNIPSVQPGNEPLLLGIESHNLIRRLLSGYYDLLHSWRWFVLVLSLAALAVCSYFATTLEPPVTSTDIQLLIESVEYEKARLWRTDLLLESVLRQSGSAAYVIWGVHAADTGDHNDPSTFSELVLDEDFDPSSTQAQIFLREYCQRFFSEDFAEPITVDYNCSINRFDYWLQVQSELPPENQTAAYWQQCLGATGIPLAEKDFHPCLSAWAHEEYDDGILSWGGIVKIIHLPYKSRVRYNSPNNQIKDEWDLIEKWMQVEREQAPSQVSYFYFSGIDYWWYDTTRSVYDTAISSGAIAIAVSALVILISSRSLSLTFFSLLSVVYVLVSVTAMMAAAGWTLGFLESICFTILIGLSADFVLHLSHAYTILPGNTDRGTRSKFALIQLGPSILAAGFTTMAGAFVMLFTVILFFRLFAMVLLFTIVQATIGSFVVFLALTDCIGPANPTYGVDYIISKCSTYFRRFQTSEDS